MTGGRWSPTVIEEDSWWRRIGNKVKNWGSGFQTEELVGMRWVGELMKKEEV